MRIEISKSDFKMLSSLIERTVIYLQEDSASNLHYNAARRLRQLWKKVQRRQTQA